MPVCTHCSNDFYAKRSDAKYCSDACRKADKRGASPDKVSEIISPDTITPDSLRAEANKLVRLQRQHRGWVTNSNGEKILAPYRPTPETEARASQIIQLRKRAARIEYPTAA